MSHFFAEIFPDTRDLLLSLTDEFFVNPTGLLATVKCFPWHVDDKALLLGDAAHAVVPFFGQGMNCSFEDCSIFNRCMDKSGPDWEHVFSSFDKERKEDADAIADMAVENYIEMRDHTADERFLLEKEVEFTLEERFPERFIPRYSMVSYHSIPYATAMKRGEIQKTILRELCSSIQTTDELDWEKAERVISEKLTPLSQQ